MTSPDTPPADLIRGLVEALREAAVPFVDPYGGRCCRICKRPFVHAYTLGCQVDCLGFKARAALAAFERRAPLRENPTLRSIVGSYIQVGPGGEEARQQFVDDCLRAIDSALFGPAAKEGSRGG